MVQPEKETLYDYKDRLDWIRKLNWSDDKLRQIPVHRQQTDQQPFISLSEVEPHVLTTLYIYKNEVPHDIWLALSNFIASLGPPSGFEQQGLEGTAVWEGKKAKKDHT